MTSVFKNWKKGSVLLTDAGWGDSGKGKVASAFKADIGAKIIGGHNAGHTIVTDKGEFGLGLIPSTIAYEKTFNVIGQEVVINPIFLIEEIKMLNKGGLKVNPKNLLIDEKSHVIMPWHEVRDALSEEARGKDSIGSLHLGVGWTYSDRINRRGLRLKDLLSSNWKKKVTSEYETQMALIKFMKSEVKRKTGKKSKVDRKLDKDGIFEIVKRTRNVLAPYSGNTIEYIWKQIKKDKKILFEDSHGAMLDISHGSWPFTTGVNTSLGAIQRSFGGLALQSLNRTVVCIKAYQTRVGGGPMPTEDSGKFGKHTQEKGGEFGTRSGRARRCGPLDIPLLKYGLNAIGHRKKDEIALPKLDVLSGLKELKVCIAYEYKGKTYKEAPATDSEFLERVKPKYKKLKGWKEDITKIRKFKKLPKEAQNYVEFLDDSFARKITLLGVGKHKNQVILR